MPQQIQISRFGGPEVLGLVTTPQEAIGHGFVRVQVRASGVNFADLMMRMGLYPEAPKPPFTPGYEIAGTVIETGPGVSSFKVGDRVVTACRFGGYTNEIILPEFQVRKIPDGMSEIEAAAIPVNYITAWLALQEMGRVRKGDRVLIQSAAGGVGTAAIQIAAQAGAYVVGLVSSKSKAKVVESLGAAEVRTYEEWENSDENYHLILDSTGGSSLKTSFKRLAPAGRLVSFGASSIVSGGKRSPKSILSFLWNTSFFTPYQLMTQNKGVFGLNVLQLFDKPQGEKTKLLLHSFDRILEEFSKGNFKTVVGKTFPLEKAGEAHSSLQSRTTTGKVVLTS